MKRQVTSTIVIGWVLSQLFSGLLGGKAIGAEAADDVYWASPSDQPFAAYDDSVLGDPAYDESGEFASQPRAFHPGAPGCCADETPLQRFRQSAYQGASLAGGVISDGGSDALTISHYDVSARFAMPIDGMENVLLITPAFRQEFVDAPVGVDIPDSLYVTGVSLMWMKTLSERWKSTAIVAPSVRSDFQTSEDAFRIFGLGILTYRYTPDLDLSFGAVYLDRDDIPLLPVLGLTWTPTPEWKFDINFPRPRISRRIDKCGAHSESWVYTGVGLGGNTWAVERADGSDDVLTLRDYQWIFGWEHLRSEGRGMFVEGGASFGRTLEYENTDEEVDFDDALFIRAGITL